MLQVKVYVSGQNLLTFTKYSGYDMDIGGQLPLEQGFNDYNYAIPRTYLVDIKITW